MWITAERLADLVFPCQCSYCNAWDKSWLCSECASKVSLLSPSDKHELRSFNGVRALTEYSNIVKDVIHQAKYENQPWRLVRFSSAILNILDDVSWLEGVNLVVPMPGDPWRTWKRGYNPARLIARELANTAKLTLAHPKSFIRLGAKPQQALSMEERSARYIDESFKVIPKYWPGSMYQKCLLVDDIGTTGATLRAAVDALTRHGISVEAMVLSIGL